MPGTVLQGGERGFPPSYSRPRTPVPPPAPAPATAPPSTPSPYPAAAPVPRRTETFANARSLNSKCQQRYEEPRPGTPASVAPRTLMAGLAGSAVLVTGAASGIGRACAKLLAQRGAAVHCLDIDEKEARAVAGSLERGAALVELRAEWGSRRRGQPG